MTAAALWSPTYSETWDPVSRAGFALSFTSPGVTAAGLRGERNLFALYEGMRGMLNVLVLEPGTFKLSGGVSDSSGGLLDDVTVEVLSGTGKGRRPRPTTLGSMDFMGWPGPCSCAYRPTAFARRYAMSLSQETGDWNLLL